MADSYAIPAEVELYRLYHSKKDEILSAIAATSGRIQRVREGRIPVMGQHKIFPAIADGLVGIIVEVPSVDQNQGLYLEIPKFISPDMERVPDLVVVLRQYMIQ